MEVSGQLHVLSPVPIEQKDGCVSESRLAALLRTREESLAVSRIDSPLIGRSASNLVTKRVAVSVLEVKTYF